MGAVPGWPGDDVFPPQQMVAQIRGVLERYRDAGGRVEMQLFDDSGHSPHIDAAELWRTTFFDFITSVDGDPIGGGG
jgi:pimeloyl-ACP methyl ester carboxylesterase